MMRKITMINRLLKRALLTILFNFRMAAGVLQEQAMLELGAVDTNELLQLLECPVCLDHITPPVKQCIKVLT